MQPESDTGFSGDRLRQESGVRGLDASTLAGACGVETRTIYAYMSGQAKPSAQVLARLVEVGFDVEWLLTGRLSPRAIGNHPSLAGLDTVTGIFADDLELGRAILVRAFRRYDDFQANSAEASAQPKPIELVYAAWKLFHFWSKLADGAAGPLRRARESGSDVEAVADLFMALIGHPMKAASS